MTWSRRNRARWPRVLAVSGFVLGWLAVMVIGAGSGDPDRNIPIPDIGDVISSLFVLMLVAGFALLVTSAVSGRGKPKSTSTRGGIGGLFMVILIALAINQIARRADEAEVEVEEQAPITAPTVQATDEDLPDDARRQQLTLLAVTAMAALGVAFVFQRQRRPRVEIDSGPIQPDEADPVVVARGLAMTAQRLRSDPDPRRAVLLAYAGLEADLGVQGRGRAPQETPYEFVARILRSVAADPEPVERLADLYHDARFSGREITPTEQEQAAAAFEQAHDQFLRHTAAGGGR